jgi:hypothetical protein
MFCNCSDKRVRPDEAACPLEWQDLTGLVCLQGQPFPSQPSPEAIMSAILTAVAPSLVFNPSAVRDTLRQVLRSCRVLTWRTDMSAPVLCFSTLDALQRGLIDLKDAAAEVRALLL